MNKLQLYFTGVRKDTCYEGKVNEVSLFPTTNHNVSSVLIGPSKKAKSPVSFIDTNEYRSVITLKAGALNGAVKLVVNTTGNYKLHIAAYHLTKHVPCVKMVTASLYKSEKSAMLMANVESIFTVVGTLADDIVINPGDAILYEVEIELLDAFTSSVKVDFIYDGQLMNIDAELKTTAGLDDSDFVHRTGDEDIAGTKTFSEEIMADAGIKFGNVNVGELPSGELGIASAGYVYSFSDTGSPEESQDVATKAYVDAAEIGCDMSSDQCAGVKANTDLSSVNKVVDEATHSADILGVLSALNTHITDDDRHLSPDERDALAKSPRPLSMANPVVDVDTLQVHIDNFTAHSIDKHLHMTSAQNAAFDGANSPSGTNVLATMNDIPAPAPPVEQSLAWPSIEKNVGGLMPTKIQCQVAANGLGIDSDMDAMYIIVDTFGVIKPHYLVHYYADTQEFYVSLMAKAV